ncbi:hypothetical protein AB0912_15415 [Streptomyces sp. NPDC007084]|uniref:hypothetical protein n=1 Tax=Streptomyces sp. NPDC007084 TaxID=3154313 RepID=UPI00345437A6
MTDPTPAPSAEQQLTSTIYDSITEFQLTAQYASLQHAQMRQYLAEHLAAALVSQPPAELAPAADTMPAWLAQRFDPRGPEWDALTDDDRTYWEHHAAAVRRAVARGGFKAAEGAQQTATLLVDRTSSSCGACGQPTLPRALAHVDVSGYAPKRGGGCGATFTAIRSVNRGVVEDDLRSLRPDLPIASS